jgi:uracil-DNA glycosylase
VSGAYGAALGQFLASDASVSWRELAPFTRGEVARVCTAVDAEAASGEAIAPAANRVFAALAATPLDRVRVVILGQDPYPTPGHANGLAFSCTLPLGQKVPRSLGNIYKELAEDTGVAAPVSGDLMPWATQGVLLLNTALTVRAGATKAGSHLALGWQSFTDAVIKAVSQQGAPTVFLLWGNPAQIKRGLIDETRHLVIASAHPSPLSARRGFFGSRPFSRANAWLEAQGRGAIAW